MILNLYRMYICLNGILLSRSGIVFHEERKEEDAIIDRWKNS